MPHGIRIQVCRSYTVVVVITAGGDFRENTWYEADKHRCNPRCTTLQTRWGWICVLAFSPRRYQSAGVAVSITKCRYYGLSSQVCISVVFEAFVIGQMHTNEIQKSL